MKIVGVMGNTGSGKTTFTSYLEQKDNVGVIHVDDIMGKAKQKYFKMFLQPKENNTTENTIKNPKIKAGAKNFFYRNKLNFSILMFVRSKLISKELDKQIEEFRKQGKSLVVIDDWALSKNKKLLNRCNHVYTLQRNYMNRRAGLRKRDGLTNFELKTCGIPYALGFIKPPIGEKCSVIRNNGSLEELYKHAEKVYERYVGLSFDEKYSLRNKSNLRTAAQKLEKVTSKGEYSQSK